MRWSCALVFLGGLLAVTPMTRADDGDSPQAFPYTAYTDAPQVSIFAEASDRLPATSELPLGTAVEVYRHDGSGWGAIRPPQGSFSWVRAEYLGPIGQDHIAQVAVEGVRPLVGCTESDQRLIWQVLLDMGELVEVLGTRRLASSDSTQVEVWCQIAPPAGEFRWIRLDDLQDEPPTPQNSAAAAERPNRDTAPTPPGVVSDSSPTTAESKPTTVRSVQRSQWTARPEDEKPADTSNDAAKEEPAVAPSSEVSEDDDVSEPKFSQPTKTDAAPARIDVADDAPFGERLRALNLQLSLALSQATKLSELQSLRAAAEQLVDTAGTTLEQGQARLLADKIARFADVAQRRANLPQDVGAVSLASLFSRAAGDEEEEVEEAGEDTVGVKFTGQGWLMPLVAGIAVQSKARAVPPYALTDDYGNVLQLVSPVPGMNLRRYERQQVGVLGEQAYLPNMKTPHLTARRVVLLKR